MPVQLEIDLCYAPSFFKFQKMFILLENIYFLATNVFAVLVVKVFEALLPNIALNLFTDAYFILKFQQ